MAEFVGQRLFRWLDRAFWLIWLAFPVMVWLVVAGVNTGVEDLAALYPEQADCLRALPNVARFSGLGKGLFWSLFVVEFGLYATLLALAHQVIHRCARGRVLVREMIGSLRSIGLLIAGWPILDLIFSNAVAWLLSRLGDMPGFLPNLVPDVTVLGVGLLLITIASAMRQAVALSEEAALTI